MKISASYWIFEGGLEGTLPISDAMEQASQLGFDAIELGIASQGVLTHQTTQAECETISEQAQQHELEISGVASGESWGCSPTSSDAKVRETILEFTQKALQVTQWLGTDAYLFVPGAVDVFFLPEAEVVLYDPQKEIREEIGKEIESIISEGDFVTDDIVNKLLNKVITDSVYKNRIIFDGYPRNIPQAGNLETILKKHNQSISAVLFLNVSRDIIEKRIIGRITCEKCNKILNEFFNTKEEIENHECGKDHLKKRKDDNYKTIATRYDAYMERTKPVLDFYSSVSYFHEIDGSQKIEVITGKIEHIINV